MDTPRPAPESDLRIASGSQNARRLWFGASSLTLGVFVVIAVGWLGGRDPGSQRQRLSDGSTLELRGVTFGDSHRFVTGVRWQKLLWPLEYPRLRERLTTIRELSLTNPVPRSLVFWLRHEPPTTPLRAAFEAFDENGAAVLVESDALYSGQGEGKESVEMWAVSTFPRRGSTVGVRMYEETGLQARTVIAEFRIRNPDPGPHPNWTPSTLPAAVQFNGLRLELRRFITRTDAPLQKRALAQNGTPWTIAGFRISRSERQALDWYPKTMVLSDASGNQWKPKVIIASYAGPDPLYGFKGSLDPRETYRIRVEFAKDKDLDRRQLPALDLPAPGKTKRLDFSFTTGTTQVSVLELMGPGAKPDPLVDYSGPHLHVAYSPDDVDGGGVVLMKVVDQSGRELEVNAAPTFNAGRGHLYFGLPRDPKVRAIRVTIGVRPTRTVEFLAKPEDAVGS